MKKLLTGNEAAAVAAKLARAQVISAYPITPQTAIVEKLAEFVANGELNAEYIKVESEHSALSACIGAAAVGARTFTATCSQGLILMSEIMFVASGMRLPVVMANVNRSLSAPLSIWCDQQDSMAVRDSGWIQIYCETNQEVLDSVIQAYKIAESTLLPVMVCFDGYIMSHTVEPVEIPEQVEVDEFLPPYKHPHPLDPKKPVTMGAVGVPDYYEEFRHVLQETLLSAEEKIVEVGKEYGRKFGREYGLLECHRCEDADIILLTIGSMSGSIKDVVDNLREKGERVGVVGLRVFRPFPVKELVKALQGAKVVAVFEKDFSAGSTGAVFADLAGGFANVAVRPLLLNFICGLGGRDITTPQILEAVELAKRARRIGKVEEPMQWLGLKEVEA